MAQSRIGSLIGYRVGGDKVDYGARIVYVTVGHLLEAVVHNPKHLESFTHIVLDEVHERFVEADFLMAFLRMFLSRPETQRQRIVVMSARFQKKQLQAFFKPALLPSPERAKEPAGISLPGGTPYPVDAYVLDDVYNMYPGAAHNCKPQDFSPLLPSRKKEMRERQWSDRLTQACRKLTKLAARLVCHLYHEHEYLYSRNNLEAPVGQYASSCVILIFLPGLDQIHELAGHLLQQHQELRKPLGLPQEPPHIILMHSALEEWKYPGCGQMLKSPMWAPSLIVEGFGIPLS